MKNIIVSISFVFLAAKGFGQVVDTAIMQVSYTVNYRPDSTNKNLKRDDILVLEVGKKTSKCYSYYRFLRDSILTGQFSDQQIIGATKFSINLNDYSKNGTSAKYFRNSITNIVTVTDKLLLNDYLYTDSTSDMKWDLTGDTLTILDYHCNKASTKFRGRNYTAWFTNEIPVSYGPLKFGGLPGLIIILYEEKGNFEFMCHSVEILKDKSPIVLEKNNYIKINRKEYKRLVYQMLENPDAFAKSMGLEFHTTSYSGPPPPKKIITNPLELE